MTVSRLIIFILLIISMVFSLRYTYHWYEISSLKKEHEQALFKVDEFKETFLDKMHNNAETCETFLKKKYDEGVYDVQIKDGFGYSSWSKIDTTSSPIRRCRTQEDSFLVNSHTDLIGVVTTCDSGAGSWRNISIAIACEVDSLGSISKAWLVKPRYNFISALLKNKYELLKNNQGVEIIEQDDTNKGEFPFNDTLLEQSHKSVKKASRDLFHKHVVPVNKKIRSIQKDSPSLFWVVTWWLLFLLAKKLSNKNLTRVTY